MQHYSQLKQDIFALNTAKHKTYIEVGASHPIKINNTYLLEKNNWQGFSVEYDKNKKSFWDDCDRTNKIYWADAITMNYLEKLAENNLPNRIGYLSIDIEPPKNTFSALKTILNSGIDFDCITFEHDNYQSDIDYASIVKKYLLTKRYKIAVDNVYRKRKFRIDNQKKKIIKNCYMETWFVKDDISFTTIDYIKWKTKF